MIPSIAKARLARAAASCLIVAGLTATALGVATGARAQDTPSGAEVLRPGSDVRLNELLEIFERRGTARIDVETLLDSLRQRGKGNHIGGRILYNPEAKSGEDLKASGKFGDSVALPGLQVTVVGVSREEGEAKFGPYLTNLSGRFATQQLPPGRYRLCATGDGYETACRGVSVGAKVVNMPPMAIRPRASDTHAVVTGRVKLADDAFPVSYRPHAGISTSAKVHLQTIGGARIGPPVIPNSLGDYVIPRVPVDQPVRIVTRWQNATGQVVIPPGQLTPGFVAQRDLTIRNSRPVFQPTVVEAAGRPVRSGAPGQSLDVTVAADDPDGDRVRYFWVIQPSDGTLSATTGSSIKWRLPAYEKLAQLRVIAWDGKGGYDERAINIEVSKKGVRFSGQVRATDMDAVPNATVEVNGQSVTTNANGAFTLYVPEDVRYVLNIRSPGHALFSQIFDRPIRGGEFTLLRATTTLVDPRQDIVITHERRDDECRGRPSANLNWEVDKQRIRPIRLKTGAEPRTGAFKGPLPAEARKRHCVDGFEVRIPAGSLVDDNGDPPGGLVEVAVATYDIEAAMEMPGDYTVSEPGTTDIRSVMQSFGAGFVEVRSGNRTFNLKSGATAEVVIPVPPNQIAAGAQPPATIPLMHYDERLGVWNVTGQAKLQGNVYVAEVDHFSAVNADIEKQTPACLHLQTGSDAGVMPAVFNLEITATPEQGSGNAAEVRTRQIDTSTGDDHVLYNLPPNRDIVLVPYDPAENIPLGTFIATTGDPYASPSNPPPQNQCVGPVAIFIPDQPRPVPGSHIYLQGLYEFYAANVDFFGDFGPSNQDFANGLLASAEDYYDRVDERHRRRTFQDFKDLWGFDGGDPSNPEYNARYANSADLGFGRDMHCKLGNIDPNNGAVGDGVACYVSNYGFRDEADQDNANQASQQDPANYVATVVMEDAHLESPPTDPNNPQDPNDPITFDTGPGRVVKFFVFAHQDPNDPNSPQVLQTAANLDLFGARPIPALCMVCHGGTYQNSQFVQVTDPNTDTSVQRPLPVFDSAASVDLGAQFLPFDLDSYTVPTAGPVTGEQQAAFKDLNEKIVLATQPLEPIREVICEYYHSGGNCPDSPAGAVADQRRKFVVDGWSGTAAEEGMYKYVVGTSCRICHVAHERQFDISFDQASDLSGAFAVYMACNERTMPHSFRTYERFWTSLSPHWPGQLVAYATEQSGQGAGTDCTFPPNNGQPAPFGE